MSDLVRLHGLTVATPFPLNAPSIASGKVDWTVTLGPVLPHDAHALDPADPVVARIDPPPSFFVLIQHSAAVYTLRFRDIGDVAIDMTARTITWRPFEHADAARLPVFTAGNVMAVVCQLDDHLVLHASAVEIDGRATVMAGDPGAGKSTIAALACLGGARLVTDDVLRVEQTDDATRCYRGATALRLREGSRPLAERAGAPSVSSDGRFLMEPTTVDLDHLPVDRILLPMYASDIEDVQIADMPKQEAALRLLSAPRIRGWTHSSAASLFDQLMDVTSAVPVLRLVIPRGYHSQDSAPERLVDALRSAG